MKTHIIFYALLTCTACAQATKDQSPKQVVPVDTIKPVVENMNTGYSPTFEKAHPNARRLMKDQFFFSVIEETAPFGSDDGADAYANFKDWRPMHRSESPVKFLHELIDNWEYPRFNMELSSFEELAPSLKEGPLVYRHISGIDAAIVAIAFGQLYLEGTIDRDIKSLAKTAVKRELLPEILAYWEEHAELRGTKLKKLLDVLNQVK
jgi:uncharacterized protein YfeS